MLANNHMNPSTPLSDIQSYIDEHVDDGLKCPACCQHVQAYWRTINAGMAVSAVRMLRLHNQAPGQFIHVPSEIGRRSAEEGKLAFWGLVEEEATLRADGGRAGYWRLTKKGVEWARGDIKVPRYAVVYNGQIDGEPTAYSKSGIRKRDVSVFDALGRRFNYQKLLNGES